MTFQQARAELKPHNMTIVKSNQGEYRVNYRGGKLLTAYYTTDLTDAVSTGVKMRERRNIYDLTKPRTTEEIRQSRNKLKTIIRKLAYRAIRWTN